MQIESIACNNCGAGLQIPDAVQFVKCNYCGSQLAVKRDEQISYTEKIEQIEVRTEAIANDVEDLKISRDLQRIETAWEREKSKYMQTDENGRQQLPSHAAAIFGGVIVVIGGLAWTVFAATIVLSSSPVGSLGPFAYFPLCGVLFAMFGVGISVLGFRQATRYREAEKRYHRRRRELLKKRNKNPGPFDFE